MVSFKVYVASISFFTTNTKNLDANESQATELIVGVRLGFDRVILRVN
jgi:hypothetical protein